MGHFGLAALALAGAAPLLRAQEARSSAALVLPPFLVEDQDLESRIDRPDWIYCEGYGLEVLSACSEEETQQYVQELRKQRIEMGKFVPDEFLLHTALPTTVILFPQSLRHAMDQEMISELERMPVKSGDPGRFRPMDDLRLSDPDSTYIFVALDDTEWTKHQVDWKWGNGRAPGFVYSPEYLTYLLESRRPPLPEWYVIGVTRFYGSMRTPWEEGGFDPDPWLGDGPVSELRQRPGAHSALLPMNELLVDRLPSGMSEDYQRMWKAQAELFVRWAYSGRIRGTREQLRRFVGAAASQPMTEQLFQDCFGMSHADALEALTGYLPVAVNETLRGPSPPSTAFRPMAFRAASKEDVHRVKGEWGRRVLGTIKEYNPDALPLYVEQDERLLQGAYGRGEHDPRLLSSLALFRIDTNEIDKGRTLLEANPEACEVRPLASLKLAWLRLGEATRHPGGPRGRLSERQALGVLASISASIESDPPMEDAFVMAASVAEHLGRNPNKAELERLNRGARLFPRNSELVLKVAAWDLGAGARSAAQQLIALGMAETIDPRMHEKLAALEITKPPSIETREEPLAHTELEDIPGVYGHPLLRTWVRPIYPPDALRQNLGGTVTLRLLIDKKGDVLKSRVLDSADPRFVEAARAATGQWLFSPALDDSKPVAGWMDVPVIFAPDNPYFKGPSPSLPPEEQLPYQSPTTPAQLDSDPDVAYPDSLFDRKLSGWARFSCVVMPDGSTAQPQILAATHVDFVLPAFNAVEHLKYTPRMNGDTPIQADVRGELKFNVYPQDDAGALAADKITAPDGTPASAGLRPNVVVDPVWPYDLLIRNEGASAVVQFTVDESGSPQDVRVNGASDPSFGEALVAAVESSSFLPPAVNGHSVKVSLIKRAEYTPVDLSAQADSNPLARLIAAIRSNRIEEIQSSGAKLSPIYRLSPIYPPSLKGAGGPPGDAEIEFIVDRDGRARVPRIISATDNRFGWSAATAVSQWVYQVPQINGQPADVRVRIPFHFNALQGSKSP
jgi:TonB family protein